VTGYSCFVEGSRAYPWCLTGERLGNRTGDCSAQLLLQRVAAPIVPGTGGVAGQLSAADHGSFRADLYLLAPAPSTWMPPYSSMLQVQSSQLDGSVAQVRYGTLLPRRMRACKTGVEQGAHGGIYCSVTST
jgi:hypothetical protein